MYAALNKHHQLCYANFIDRLNMQQEFYCPLCLEPVKLCKRKNSRYYFRHQKKCLRQVENRYHQKGNFQYSPRKGESTEHKTAKEILEKNFKSNGYDTYKEYKLTGSNQTADLITVTPNHSSFQIIEYQKSIIPQEDLSMRHQEYLRLANEIRWLVDDSFLKNGINRKWISQMLSFDQTRLLHLYALNISEKKLVLFYQLPLVYQLESYAIQTIEYTFSEDWHQNIFSKSLCLQYGTQKEVNFHKNYKIRELDRKTAILKNKSYFKVLKALYKWGVSFHELPEWIFASQWKFLCFRQNGWIILAWSYVAWTQSKPAYFNKKLEFMLKYLIEAGYLTWTPMPLMDQDFDIMVVVIECIQAIFHIYQNKV